MCVLKKKERKKKKSHAKAELQGKKGRSTTFAIKATFVMEYHLYVVTAHLPNSFSLRHMHTHARTLTHTNNDKFSLNPFVYI